MVSRWYFPCLTSMCWRPRSRRTQLSPGESERSRDLRKSPSVNAHSRPLRDHVTVSVARPGESELSLCHCDIISPSHRNVLVFQLCKYFPRRLWRAFSLYSWFTCWLVSAYVGRERFRMMIVGSLKRNNFSISSPGWLAKVDTVTALTYIVLHGKSYNIGVSASLRLSSGMLSFTTNRSCTAARSTQRARRYHFRSAWPRGTQTALTQISQNKRTFSCVVCETKTNVTARLAWQGFGQRATAALLSVAFPLLVHSQVTAVVLCVCDSARPPLSALITAWRSPSELINLRTLGSGLQLTTWPAVSKWPYQMHAKKKAKYVYVHYDR